MTFAKLVSGGPLPDFTVSQYGTDTSGRPIYLTAYMHQWWEGVCRELGFTPTIVQGAWMARVSGGGADQSAGYHDGGGCIDLRVWDLTATQVESVIHATRWGGAGAWVRDQTHGGMDPHIHLVLGSDDALAPGAAWQWINYINGGDGLSSGGRDYHPRPSPIVQVPPDSLMGDDMAEYGPKILEELKQLRERMNEAFAAERARDRDERADDAAQLAQITAALDTLAADVSDDATRRQVAHVKDLLKTLNNPTA